MTLGQQLQQEITTLPVEAMEEVLHFIRFLKWEREDYVDDPRLSQDEKRDGLSYDQRQSLLREKQHTQQTGELYSWQEVF